MDKLYIYALTDPDTGEYRYIGCSKQPHKRLNEHWQQQRDHGAKAKWIKSLKRKGSNKPGIVILDTCRKEIARDLERKYYEYYAAQGCKLLNSKLHLAKRIK